MQKYNIELKFMRGPNDSSPVTGVCCFSGLPDNVSKEEVQTKLTKIITNEFHRAKKNGRVLDLYSTSMAAMQQVAQKYQCCSFMVGIDGIVTFMLG